MNNEREKGCASLTRHATRPRDDGRVNDATSQLFDLRYASPRWQRAPEWIIVVHCTRNIRWKRSRNTRQIQQAFSVFSDQLSLIGERTNWWEIRGEMTSFTMFYDEVESNWINRFFSFFLNVINVAWINSKFHDSKVIIIIVIYLFIFVEWSAMIVEFYTTSSNFLLLVTRNFSKNIEQSFVINHRWSLIFLKDESLVFDQRKLRYLSARFSPEIHTDIIFSKIHDWSFAQTIFYYFLIF